MLKAVTDCNCNSTKTRSARESIPAYTKRTPHEPNRTHRVPMKERLFYSLVQDEVDIVEAKLAEVKAEFEPNCGSELQTQGKRLRPILFLLSNRFTRFILGEDMETSPREIAIAVAIELVHEASLIHDDIVDGSELRRGKPSLNNSLGNAMALLVGDYLFARFYTLVLDHTDKLTDIRTISCLAEIALHIVRGELQQLAKVHYSTQASERTSVEAYLDIITAKTALFFAGCCEAGGALAGADRRLKSYFHMFGLNLGIAFQIMDDVLDVTGNEVVVGKSLRQNVGEKTITLPFILAYENNSRNPLLQKVIAGESMTPKEQTRIYRMLSSKTVIRNCHRIMENYMRMAQEGLLRFPRSIYRLAFEDLIEFLVKREH